MIFDGPVTEENRMALEAELARQKEIFSRESAESKRAIRQAASMTHWIETFPLPSAALFFGGGILLSLAAHHLLAPTYSSAHFGSPNLD